MTKKQNKDKIKPWITDSQYRLDTSHQINLFMIVVVAVSILHSII